MTIFSKATATSGGPSKADIENLIARLDTMAGKLEAHCIITEAHGELLAHMPAAVTHQVRADLKEFRGELMSWLYDMAKKKAVENGSRILINSVYGSVVGYGVWFVHTFFTGSGK
jgi:hypothetical protein